MDQLLKFYLKQTVNELEKLVLRNLCILEKIVAPDAQNMVPSAKKTWDPPLDKCPAAQKLETQNLAKGSQHPTTLVAKKYEKQSFFFHEQGSYFTHTKHPKHAQNLPIMY